MSASNCLLIVKKRCLQLLELVGVNDERILFGARAGPASQNRDRRKEKDEVTGCEEVGTVTERTEEAEEIPWQDSNSLLVIVFVFVFGYLAGR